MLREITVCGREAFGICNARGKFCPVGCSRVIYLRRILPLKLLQSTQRRNFNAYKDLVSSCPVLFRCKTSARRECKPDSKNFPLPVVMCCEVPNQPTFPWLVLFSDFADLIAGVYLDAAVIWDHKKMFTFMFNCFFIFISHNSDLVLTLYKTQNTTCVYVVKKVAIIN